MIEKLKTKRGFALVSENYIDVTDRERHPQPEGVEGGQVWIVVKDGMSVHRFFFPNPQEAETFSAMVQHAADKAKALAAMACQKSSTNSLSKSPIFAVGKSAWKTSE